MLTNNLLFGPALHAFRALVPDGYASIEIEHVDRIVRGTVYEEVELISGFLGAVSALDRPLLIEQ